MTNNYPGFFGGRTLIQQSGSIGGARSVFVKLQGIKNELVYPTFGGMVINPFKGRAKIYAGDLAEYRTVGEWNGTILLLKSYKVLAVNGSTVSIEADYGHKPFVGDSLAVAPADVEDTVTPATVTAVAKAKVGKVNVWEVTFDAAIGAVGDVLVEAGDDGKVLVKNPNTIIPWDMDFFYEPATGDDDFDGARYMITPALHGVMYEHKMSPLPEYVKAFNKSRIVGWFEL